MTHPSRHRPVTPLPSLTGFLSPIVVWNHFNLCGCVSDSVSMYVWVCVCVYVIAWGYAWPTFTAALGLAVCMAVKTLLPASLGSLIAGLSFLERVALKCSELKASEQPSIDKVSWRILQTAAHQRINNAGTVKRGRVADRSSDTTYMLLSNSHGAYYCTHPSLYWTKISGEVNVACQNVFIWNTLQC